MAIAFTVPADFTSRLFIQLNQLDSAQFVQLPQFMFEIAGRGFYRFGQKDSGF